MQLVLGQTYNNRVVTHLNGCSAILQCNYCKIDILVRSRLDKMRSCRYCNHVDQIYERAVKRRSEWVLKDIEEFKKYNPPTPVIKNPPANLSAGWRDNNPTFKVNTISHATDLNVTAVVGNDGISYTSRTSLSNIFVGIREELKALNHNGINSFINKSNFNVWEGKKLVTLNVPAPSPLFKGKNPSLSYYQEIWEPICKKYLGDEYTYSLYFY